MLRSTTCRFCWTLLRTGKSTLLCLRLDVTSSLTLPYNAPGQRVTSFPINLQYIPGYYGRGAIQSALDHCAPAWVRRPVLCTVLALLVIQ